MNVVPSELGRFEPVDDLLVLAAVERAVLHIGRSEGVRLDTVAEHLGVRPGSWTTRRLRPQLESLGSEGALVRSRRLSHDVWALSDAGLATLEAARAMGDPVELPESPQHRLWRRLHTEAGERLERIDGELRASLAHAGDLVEDPQASSDAWFELATSLGSACRRLGGAIYCLREWVEPDDAHPDRDVRLDPGDELLPPAEQRRLSALRAGRRNPHDWG
ncbi:MAG TPA: hypothetical protein VH061_16645 [Solirubrobacteraceae bacterium]|jgi:hypothetical protein|nr:hypothetical protein [Solirubrobacteraceae bacterium]